ncbi:MAG: site-specific DNA-methyltransferase [Candidatus Lokiarchaeota archaeon]|nr:site-specific DNA-methyltransferase [Candidatus Lokiarchaeota archaeon]
MINLNWENKKDFIDNLNLNIDQFRNKFQNITFLLNNEKKISKIDNNNSSWNRKLFWGNNLEVLYYLSNFLKEKVDLVYIDPPFFSGTNYNIQINEQGDIYKDIAYNDKWNKDIESYLQMLYKRLFIIKNLLSDKGLIFIHLDWHANHYVKIILDDLFGVDNFINSIVWYYYNKYSAGKKHLPKAHDDILVYSKTKHYSLNEIRIPREKPIKQLKRININGTLKNFKDKNGKVVYRMVNDKKLDDVWKIPCLQPASKHWTGYPTQKHHRLIERIIKLGSDDESLVADFFCGSGTTLIEAEKLKRRWIGVDVSKYAIYIARKILLDYYTESKIDKHPILELYANLDDEKKEIINSNFFNKKLDMKRKN